MLILDACTNVSVLGTVLFIKKIVQIISIIVPILLVLLITIDFAKAVMANSDDDMKRAQRLAIKRIIAGLIVFFVPLIVDTAFTSLSDKGVSGLSCYDNASDEVLSPLIEADKANLQLKEAERKKLIEEAKKGYQAAEAYLTTLKENMAARGSSSSGTAGNNYNVVNVTGYTKSNGYISHATSASRGRTDTYGDQTGKEVTIAKNTYKWTYIARFKDPAKAEIAARCVEAGAKNDNIGYGVNGYTSLYTYAKQAKWDLSKINKKCNTVCSAFIAVCINATGTKITKNLNGYSDSVKTNLKNTGAFDFYDYKKKNVMRGDVLVIRRQHVGMAI